MVALDRRRSSLRLALLTVAAAVALALLAVCVAPLHTQATPAVLDTSAGWAATEATITSGDGVATVKRAHPPHAAAATLTPTAFFALIKPIHPATPLAPQWVMLASALFFALLFLFVHALHLYWCAHPAAEIAVARAEVVLRAGLKLDADAASRRARSNGHAAVSPLSSLIQVIPAVGDPDQETSAPSGLRAGYWHAYAQSIASGDRANGLEWSSRIVSNVHAVISCTLGLVCFASTSSRVDPSLLTNGSTGGSISGASLFNPFSAHFTPSLLAFNEEYARDLSLMVTCGYLAWDLVLCLWARWSLRSRNGSARGRTSIEDGLTLVHHVLIICAFSYGCFTHIGTYFMSCFLLNEVSSPGLNANFFLAALGEEWRASRLYKINGVVLFLVFFIARVLFNLYVVGVMVFTWFRLRPLFLRADWPYFHPLHATDEPPMSLYFLAQCALLSTLAVGHVVINLVWFSSLYRAIRRKLCRNQTTKQTKLD